MFSCDIFVISIYFYFLVNVYYFYNLEKKLFKDKGWKLPKPASYLSLGSDEGLPAWVRRSSCLQGWDFCSIQREWKEIKESRSGNPSIAGGLFAYSSICSTNICPCNSLRSDNYLNVVVAVCNFSVHFYYVTGPSYCFSLVKWSDLKSY